MDSIDWFFGILIGICLAGVLVLLGLLIFTKPNHDYYCGSGWSSVCVKVPAGQKPQATPDGCITDGTSKVCGSYEKE